MKTIFKYELQLTDVQTLRLPGYYQVLCVQVQNGKPCLWAAVDPSYPGRNKGIRIIGTGHQFSDYEDLEYISTFQLEDGALVFHVFEVISP